jgi:hypothetical protein
MFVVLPSRRERAVARHWVVDFAFVHELIDSIAEFSWET